MRQSTSTAPAPDGSGSNGSQTNTGGNAGTHPTGAAGTGPKVRR